ncbi:MAG: glycosyltransferase family 39 protein, partial [Planctomycetota bacterium]|nr:glycosyltransferase family 39 protein [Planctomycetota bacterium]
MATRAGVAVNSPPDQAHGLEPVTPWEITVSLLLGCVATGVSAFAGQQFGDLPPAIHDEYSYLFQARTFLAGRVAFDSPPLRDLFNPMHVLNEGKMASRYFPATGVWLAPFVAAGHPIWGWWLAQGVFTVLVYWIGRELAGRRGARSAALLTAVCPGLVLFSNMLLAHHPTLLGLGLFALGFLRMRRLNCRRWAFLAGAGLAFAALARPMTAASVGFPWGLYLLFQAVGNRTELRFWPALAAPLLIGAGAMLIYDDKITGHATDTPYGMYTRVYTPRHGYGFNNVTRGERQLGPRVIENYDRWADNLTGELALRNAKYRLLASAMMTLGILPLVFGTVLGLVFWRQLPVGAKLCLASIVSLHIAHIPYWFDGILHFHYVFESLPLWLVFLATVGQCAIKEWNDAGRVWIPRWCAGALLVCVALNYTTEQSLWSAPYRAGTG